MKIKKEIAKRIRERMAQSGLKSSIKDTIKEKAVNPYDVEKIPTGIKQLDANLKGGIPRGYLTLLAGYEGSGKSHFVSQIIAEGIDQGHMAFLMSGEQSGGQSNQILTSQLSGGKMMTKVTSKTGFKYSKVDEKVKDFIQKEYEESVQYYEPSRNVRAAYQEFLQTLQIAVEEGIDFFIIDNLMTLKDVYASDDMGRGLSDNTLQGGIANMLAQFASTYNVYVVLAVHKRKVSGQGVSFNINNEILGSSNVANAGGLIIHFDASPAFEGDVQNSGRRAKITKNRLFGFTDFVGVEVKYDVAGHRLFSDFDDKEYSWQASFIQKEVEEDFIRKADGLPVERKPYIKYESEDMYDDRKKIDKK